jgi:hypothetical protein
MAGFGMDKDYSSRRGGFGMPKSGQADSFEPYSEEDILPEYMELDSKGEVFDFYYSGMEEIEKILEVDTEKSGIKLEGENFSDADYEIFIERAENALHQLGELEKPYTLLEQVNDYA